MTDNKCKKLNELRLANTNCLVLGYININSNKTKIELFKPIISGGRVDVITIAETKLDETFPTSQFVIEGSMRPFRLDRSKNGGGLLVYIKEGLPVKQL